jgi:hypothetical protein
LKTDDWDMEQVDTVGYGGNAYLDYLLPIGIPLSLGFEAGIDRATTTATDGFEDEIQAIPLLARVAYHFDISSKLDLYLVGKIGYAFGRWSGDSYDFVNANDGMEYTDYKTTDPAGLAYGFDIGVAFYFTSRIGIFAEAGFDQYLLKATTTGKYNEGYDPDWGSTQPLNWVEETIEFDLPFTRFLTLGISAKF